MPILMPRDTTAVLKPDAANCQSRSLFFDRLADPSARDSANSNQRRKWFERAIRINPEKICRRPLSNLLKSGKSFYGQLQSRLMINMAGGVMENAGLSLDRFGLPLISGSALKGCARRMAIQELLEMTDADTKRELLKSIALVFGWVDQDWSDVQRNGLFVSDFAYAIGAELWPVISKEIRSNLPLATSFAGLVAFLPADPVDAVAVELPLRCPMFGALELDVLTCHHTKYYKNPREVATDDDKPNPVLFPTVAAGQVFEFTICPLRQCPSELLGQARTWLMKGLDLFGVGAKTAAGYGWFDCSESLQIRIREEFERRAALETSRKIRESELESQRIKQEDARRRRESERAALANLSPAQQEDYRTAALTEDQFRSALDNFGSKSSEQQKALVRCLRIEPGAPGSRRGFWDELKRKAAKKGGKWAQTEQAIRQLSKQMFVGKEGKMP